mgnify:CR=1 FL=1
MLVHGGGKKATEVANKLQLEPKLIDIIAQTPSVTGVYYIYNKTRTTFQQLLLFHFLIFIKFF